jgi:hypothetical protein
LSGQAFMGAPTPYAGGVPRSAVNSFQAFALEALGVTRYIMT